MAHSNLAYGVLRKCAEGEGETADNFLQKVRNAPGNLLSGAKGKAKEFVDNVVNIVTAPYNAYKTYNAVQDAYNQHLQPIHEAVSNNDIGGALEILSDDNRRKGLGKFFAVYRENSPTINGYLEGKNGADTSDFYRTMPDGSRKHFTYGELRKLMADVDKLRAFEDENFTMQARALHNVNLHQSDQKWLMSPEGRRDLALANAGVSNPQLMGWLAQHASAQYKILDQNVDKIKFAANNYGTLKDMYNFQQSPLSWLLSALFNRDPNNLYSMINNINQIYTPGTEYNRHIMPMAKGVFKENQWALPWLNMAGNVRSMFEGDGKSFSTPTETYYGQ